MFTIIFKGTHPTLGGSASVPVNSDKTLDEAIETARADMKGDKSWSDSFEILDDHKNSVHSEKKHHDI